MADGPTVQQIVAQRNATVTACEATGKAERSQIENSSTLGLPLLEYAALTLKHGPSGLKAMLTAPIEVKEHLCKYRAQGIADKDMAIREATLEVGKKVAEADAHSKALVLAATEKANQKYRELLKDRGRPLEPNLNRPQGPQTLLAKK